MLLWHNWILASHVTHHTSRNTSHRITTHPNLDHPVNRGFLTCIAVFVTSHTFCDNICPPGAPAQPTQRISCSKSQRAPDWKVFGWLCVGYKSWGGGGRLQLQLTNGWEREAGRRLGRRPFGPLLILLVGEQPPSPSCHIREPHWEGGEDPPVGELLAWQCSYRPVQWGRQTLINPVNPHPGWSILLHRGGKNGKELDGVLT